jgi:hypothetical protein
MADPGPRTTDAIAGDQDMPRYPNIRLPVLPKPFMAPSRTRKARNHPIERRAALRKRAANAVRRHGSVRFAFRVSDPATRRQMETRDGNGADT